MNWASNGHKFTTPIHRLGSSSATSWKRRSWSTSCTTTSRVWTPSSSRSSKPALNMRPRTHRLSTVLPPTGTRTKLQHSLLPVALMIQLTPSSLSLAFRVQPPMFIRLSCITPVTHFVLITPCSLTKHTASTALLHAKQHLTYIQVSLASTA